MTNDDVLAEAIRLIKAGQKDSARALLEPFLLKHPNHIQAWMWETELFAGDQDKIKVLEVCLKQNPGHPQVLQALALFKKRQAANPQPIAPASSSAPSSYLPPPPVYPATTPASYRTLTPEKPASPASPFSAQFDQADDESPPYGYQSLALYPPDEDEAPPQPAPQPAVVAETPKRSQPAATPKALSQKKSKGLTPALRNLFLVMLAVFACLVLTGFYLGGGYYLNGQINQAFIAQDCPSVVQQTSFVSLYPEGLFGSIFGGHAQYTECRLSLEIEQAVTAKNWEVALAQAQQYLAAYPNGVFAASLSEQPPIFLASWAAELIASHNYGSGIEKLKQLRETYPNSPAAQPASESILQTYLLWSRELTDKQNYKEAEPHLIGALAYFQADAARTAQVKQEMVNLYVGWGNQQAQAGDLDGAVKTYQKAAETFPGTMDVDLLVARAYLQKALEISKTRNFDKALAKVQEVADTAQAENIKAEAEAARTLVLNEYSASTAPQATDQMAAAISLTCQGQRPELPIFGLNPDMVRFGYSHPFLQLPADWAATTPGELRYVICSSEAEEKIQTCDYTKGFFMIRMRYVWTFTVYDLLSGESVATNNLKGADPNSCPPVARFLAGSTNSKMYGKRPTAEALVAWLATLNLIK